MHVGVNFEVARKFGEAARGIINRLALDRFDDERFYPPAGEDREVVSRYFLVMVAMDHRLSRPGRPYEGFVDGEFYHGADLLYRLGAKKLEDDPDFFSPERLARMTARDVLEWLTVRGPSGRLVRPPDPELRATLLRDIGVKLDKLFGGSAYSIIERAGGFLKNGSGGGFIDLLKVFIAYQDPVEKKAYLLAKFLERRKVLIVLDGYNKEVPVDNHLARIAVRLGIVDVDGETLEAIASGRPFTWEEDAMIRMAARVGFKEAARAGGIDPFVLDDFLWMFGRKCCTREAPTCRAGCRPGCRALRGCVEGQCVFQGFCRAVSNPLYMVPEHTYLDTWYY